MCLPRSAAPIQHGPPSRHRIRAWSLTALRSFRSQRQRLENDFDSESDYEPDEEAPQVVVLQKGDLTAEQAEQEQQRIEKGKCQAMR